MTDTGNELLDSDSSGADAAAGEPQRVPINMYETSGAMVIIAPLPAVMPEDVEVIVEDGSLRITSDMRSAAAKDYLLHEWHYGPYERQVDLPEGFGGTAEAILANGQLSVRIERGAASGTRSVEVIRK